jgi:hypothetical protein
MGARHTVTCTAGALGSPPANKRRRTSSPFRLACIMAVQHAALRCCLLGHHSVDKRDGTESASPICYPEMSVLRCPGIRKTIILRKHPIRTFSIGSSFVSKHFVVTTKDVKQLVEAMDTEYRTAGDRVEVKHCRLCSKGNQSKPDNCWKLYINGNGSFHCFRCSTGGSWYQLKNKVYGTKDMSILPKEVESGSENASESTVPVLPNQKSVFFYTKVSCFI